MWAKVENGAVVAYPYGPSELKRDNPQTSFPDVMSDETLVEWGVVSVVSQDPPTYDWATQDCLRVDPVLNGDIWVETWSIVPLTQQEMDRRKEEKSSQVRVERNIALAASDWTQVADAPVDKTLWAVYRQELRDISNQEGFPFNVTWPNPPQ